MADLTRSGRSTFRLPAGMIAEFLILMGTLDAINHSAWLAFGVLVVLLVVGGVGLRGDLRSVAGGGHE